METADPLVEPPQFLPCTRCGTFAKARLTLLEKHRWCEGCTALLAKELRLWPYGYLVAVGALLNFVPAAVMLALNWRRLQLPARARGMWIAAGLGYLLLAVLIVADSAPGIQCGINAVITFIMARSYAPVWKELKGAGFKRANVVLPILLTLLSLVPLVLYAFLFERPE